MTYKVGDRVLAKRWLSSIFTAKIEGVQKRWYGTRYVASWTVRDHDYNPPVEYQTTDFLKPSEIISYNK